MFRPTLSELYSSTLDFLFEFSKSLIPPDNLHDLTIAALKHPSLLAPLKDSLQIYDKRLETMVYGVKFFNPLVLDAGFCKDGDTAESLQYLGQGSTVIGSVRKEQYAGNTGRQLIRYDKQKISGNAMWMPSKGMAHVEEYFASSRSKIKTPLWLNVIGRDVNEFVDIFRSLGDYFELYEINLGCPTDNTAEKFTSNLIQLEKLLDVIRSSVDITKPVFVKIQPVDVDKPEEKRYLHGLSELADSSTNLGLTISNTKPCYHPKIGRLGLGGGRDLFEKNIKAIREIREHDHSTAIKISGGVRTGYDVAEALRSGADLAGVVTELMYGGMETFKRINFELLEVMEANEIQSVDELIEARRLER